MALPMLLVLALSLTATEMQDFAEAKKLIDSKVECAQLSEEQLERMGDYYMEQMHPGEAHELMDQMMGGEGSESLKQAHVFMAKRLYCGETASSGMMAGCGMMGGMMGSGMMQMMGGSGMMGNTYGTSGKGSSFGAASFWSGYNILPWLLSLVTLLLLGLAVYKLSKK